MAYASKSLLAVATFAILSLGLRYEHGSMYSPKRELEGDKSSLILILPRVEV